MNFKHVTIEQGDPHISVRMFPFYLFLLVFICGNIFNYSLAAQTQQPDFSQYDIIITRQPFGMPPAAPVSPAVAGPIIPQGPPPESFIKQLQIAAITEDEAGIRVGLVNLKTQQALFLSIGDSTDEGVVLVDAKYNEGGALLRYENEEYWIYFDGRISNLVDDSSGENQDTSTSVEPVQDMQAPINITQQRAVMVAPAVTPTRATSGAASTPGQPLSYIERLKMRRESMAKAEQQKIEAAATQKLENVDREDLLRQYNLELIRAKGAKGSPLPIQLTPEEDAQLVREGVLPPSDQ